jgi:hypothetical protein
MEGRIVQRCLRFCAVTRPGKNGTNRRFPLQYMSTKKISSGSAEKQSLIFPRILRERENEDFRFISQYAFFGRFVFCWS